MSVGDDQRAAREAADWLARLNSRAVSTEELNAFYEWRRDPQNAAAYERGERLWHDARQLGDDRDIARAVREALERPRVEEGRRVSRRMVLAASGSLVLATAGGAWWLAVRAQTYRTEIGEQLLVRLDDGSRMRLNTDSEAEVRFSSTARFVALARGQALFEVAHDPARPFHVESRGFEVQALGTRFEVAAIDGRPARVLLVDGRIAIASDDAEGWRRVLDNAGDSLSIDGEVSPVAGHEDVALATSWTGGRLTFRRTPLAAAVAEVNRYSRTRIELAAPDHADLEVDGVFETGDPDAFVAAVIALFPLRAQRTGPDRIVLTGA